MHGLGALAWRSIAARKLRSALTVAGIALGVGVLFAALATNAGIDSSITRTVSDLVGRADLRIAGFRESGLSPASVDAIRGTPGVAVAAPAIERRTYLGPSPTSLGGPLPPPVTVLGIDPQADPEVHDISVVEGSPLARPSEPSALITERLARDDGIRLGDEITLNGVASASLDDLRFRVIGIVSGEGPLIGAFGRVVIVPIDRAARVFGLTGVTRVDVRVAGGTPPEAVIAALESRLTTEPYVLSRPSDLAAALRASTTDFQSTTALIAAIALFGGAFLIFNTLSMSVAERIREIGLLRAAGTTRRQVVGFVLVQALALGVFGSIAGVALGIALAFGMTGYVREIFSIRLDAPAVPPVGIALAVVVGVLVTLAAALEPAVRAGRISPIEALRARLEPAGGQGARLRWLAVVFAAVAVVGVLVRPLGSGDAEAVRALSVYGLLLLVTLASPFLLGPLGRIAGVPFALILRAEERLARSSLARDRSRAALTVGALTVGLAMIVALGWMAQVARRAGTEWIDSVVPGDELITSIRPVALDEGIGEQFAAVPGVARVTPIATFDAAYRGIRLDAAAVVGADVLADGRLSFVAGDRDSALRGLDAGGTVLLPQAQATRLGLAVGDTMTFALGGGRTAHLRVTGIVERTLPGHSAESILVGWSDATNLFGVLGADVFAVRFAPGRFDAARPALEQLARSLALEPNTLDRVQGAISDALGRVFGLFDALAAVAVVVAGLGIVNTLSMDVLERIREIGVLRAVGMTRRQVRRMVVVQAGILGIVGAILGIVAGLATGAVMVVLAAGGRPALILDVPWPTLGFAALFGIVIAMLASYYPARLASGLSIVRAFQAE